MDRDHAYGQRGRPSLVDRFGIWLSRRWILRCLEGRTGLVALDVGCGFRALHLRAIQPHLRSGTGVDVSVDPNVKAIPGLTFVEDAAEAALPRLPAGFDLVLLNSVLEHLDRPLEVLRECHRVLGPDGLLLVNVPTWRGKWFLEFSAFVLGTSPAAEMDDHRMYFDLRDLWPLLVRAGFKPSRIRAGYHKFGLNLYAVCRKAPSA